MDDVELKWGRSITFSREELLSPPDPSIEIVNNNPLEQGMVSSVMSPD